MKKTFIIIAGLVVLAGLVALAMYLAGKKSSDDLSSLFRGEVDSFPIDDGTDLDIYSIKHGSVAINVSDKWIYVDPVTTAALPETDFSVIPKADYILFTHDHYDHFDTLAVKQLSKDGTIILANASTIDKLGYGCSLSNGKSYTTAEGWTVDAVPAYNNSPEKLQFHPKGRDNGYVLSFDGVRIYIAGDTEVIPELEEIKDIDIAFLPCNLPYTMTPEQCAEAARIVSPRVLFPYHYGGSDIETDLQALIDLLEGSGIEVRIRQYA